jgi:1,4-dihydroxy-2-naphthoate octaprenyltransferase
MATVAQWVGGARPRTLAAAVAPVLVGAGGASLVADVSVAVLLLALVFSVLLQVGVNYANDYSDGVRGTDEQRVGPVRLVGQRLADPARVKAAAWACFGVGAAVGLLVVAVSRSWLLIPIGLSAIAAGWFYTGGRRPYGYRGLGEVAVFIYFGLAATLGTQYALSHMVTWIGLVSAIGVGLLASAILVANNLRDIPTDSATGKVTLAVRLGDARTRMLYLAMLGGAAVAVSVVALRHVACWVALAAYLLAVAPVRLVRGGAVGPTLVRVLAGTNLLLLAYGVLLAGALAVS